MKVATYRLLVRRDGSEKYPSLIGPRVEHMTAGDQYSRPLTRQPITDKNLVGFSCDNLIQRTFEVNMNQRGYKQKRTS